MKNNMHMNTFMGRIGLLIVVLTGLISGCADPTFVGADILEDDRVNAGFTDTVTIRSRTVRGDSVLTYAPGPIWLNAYLFGDFQDPLFGRTFAEFYAQPTLELSTVSYLRPNFEGGILDSVVLVLPYSAAGFYGDTLDPFTIEVYELMDSLQRDSAYYSSTVLNYQNLIASKTFLPTLDSVTFIDYRTSSPDTVSLAQLRIPMSETFQRRLFGADTTAYLSNANWQRFFRGFVARPATTTNGMISFDMLPSGGAHDAGIYVYFTRDSVPNQYRFPISYNSPVVGHYENEYGGSPVAPYINSASFSDSIGLVQGTEGLLMELEFPNLEGLENVIVNKAELIIPVGALPGDDPGLFPPAARLYAFYYDADLKSYVPVEDIFRAASGALDFVFGGVLESGSNGRPDTYRINISAFFQEMLEDDRVSDIRDVIYLGVAPRSERVSRSILYGASHPQHPIKLNLTYTSQ